MFIVHKLISVCIGDGDKLSCPPESVNFTDTTKFADVHRVFILSEAALNSVKFIVSYTVQAKPVSMVSARNKTLLGSSDTECFILQDGQDRLHTYLITLATIKRQFTEGTYIVPQGEIHSSRGSSVVAKILYWRVCIEAAFRTWLHFKIWNFFFYFYVYVHTYSCYSREGNSNAIVIA